MSSEPKKDTQAEQSSGQPRRKRFLVILLAAILLLAVIVWYLFYSVERMSPNEESAVEQLRIILCAQAIHCQDFDRNGLCDYWTADVAGLYALERSDGTKVGFIQPELAQADFAPAKGPYSWVPPEKPIPRQGYYYMAMTLDEYGIPYRQDPDNGGKDYTNWNKFGYCAFPANYGIDGTMTFILDQGGTIWRKDTGGNPATRWPDQDTLATEWEAYDYYESHKWYKIAPPDRQSYPDDVWVIKITSYHGPHGSQISIYQDQLTFSETKMSSNVFASQGYAPAEYTHVKYRTETKWESIQKNKNGDTATWRGRASGGDYLYGKLIVKSADGKENDFDFESIKTGPPLPEKENNMAASGLQKLINIKPEKEFEFSDPDNDYYLWGFKAGDRFYFVLRCYSDWWDNLDYDDRTYEKLIDEDDYKNGRSLIVEGIDNVKKQLKKMPLNSSLSAGAECCKEIPTGLEDLSPETFQDILDAYEGKSKSLRMDTNKYRDK